MRPSGADNYLKWRRSIDEHLELRRLTWDEYAMFNWFCTKASPRTGTLRTSWPTLGKRLYALRLSHDQAGVTWSHYQIRKAKLDAALRPSLLASALVRDVTEAACRVLPRFGAWLYHRQRVKGSMLSEPEWRRIWQAYQARRLARPA